MKDKIITGENFCLKANNTVLDVIEIINENQFQKVLPDFEGPGQTISQYMVPAYYWLGWGIKGNRELYAYNYSNKLVLV